VIRQNLLASLAQPCAVLLETPQNDHVALVHQRPAKPRHIPRATGIGPAALRRGCGDDQEEGNGEQKSGHLESPHYAVLVRSSRRRNGFRTGSNLVPRRIQLRMNARIRYPVGGFCKSGETAILTLR
jgi:hypothetical protein